MTDLRLDSGFLDHPKTVKTRRRLGDVAVLALLRLWCFTADNRPTGTLSGFDAEDIAIAAGWDGDAGKFVADLVDLRWLDKDANGILSVHDWQDRQPWICTRDQRVAKAKAAADARWRNATGMPEALPGACDEHARSYAPNLTQPNPTKETPPDGGGEQPGKPGVPPCPHQEIIAAYHEALPQCPTVRSWSDKRKRSLAARWREDPQRQNVQWWKNLFDYIGESKFLTGKTEGRNGSPPFIADLEWICKESNMAKIIEGKYNR